MHTQPIRHSSMGILSSMCRVCCVSRVQTDLVNRCDFQSLHPHCTSILIIAITMRSSSLFLCWLVLLAAVSVSMVATPAVADHCNDVCCGVGWSYYSYAVNVTKRAAVDTPSDCACLSDTTASACKPTQLRPHHVASPQPNDHCYGACCPQADPSLKDSSPKPLFMVSSYSYADYEMVRDPRGDCVCLSDATFECQKTQPLAWN